MSSNYPPGVTGREYAIAGPDYERDEQRECDAEGVAVRVADIETERNITKAIEIVERIRRGESQPSLSLLLTHLRTAQSSLGTVELVECRFVGDVTVVGCNGVETWVCPLCGTDYETELEPPD